jgi:hypothetical protein
VSNKSKRKKKRKVRKTPAREPVVHSAKLFKNCPGCHAECSMYELYDGNVRMLACNMCGGASRGPRVGRPTEARSGWDEPWEKC